MTTFAGDIYNIGLYFNEQTPTYNSDECVSYRSAAGAIGGSIGGVIAFCCIGGVIYLVCCKNKNKV